MMEGPSNSIDDNDAGDGDRSYTILALYKFCPLSKPVDELKDLLENFLRPLFVRGLLLLAAEEGINGTISFPSNEGNCAMIQSFLKELFLDDSDDSHPTEDDDQQYRRFRFAVSFSSSHPFHRFKVKIRQEIVSMGVSMKEIIPNFAGNNEAVDDVKVEADNGEGGTSIRGGVGHYVKPGAEWHNLLEDPNCLVIDTRNDYEVALGTFQNARDPNTKSFTEFPEWFRQQKEKSLASSFSDSTTTPGAPQTFDKVAMFCTGGIRCEKASAYCVANLPKDVPVYHLEGGVLGYLNQVPEEESRWQGECYVFDQRIAVGHGSKPSQQYTTSCHACRHPLSQGDLSSSDFVKGIACPYCRNDPEKEQKRYRYEHRQKLIELSKEKGNQHIHDPKELDFQSDKRLTTVR